MPQQTVYWSALEIAVLVVFAAGLYGNARFWLQGGIRPGRPAGAGDKARLILGGLGAVLRPRVLGGVLLDALFQRRLLRLSPVRWLAHACLFWGMGGLFFIGSVGLMLAERGLVSVTKDTPWFALVNDLAGLLVIFGAAMAASRGAARKASALEALRGGRGLALGLAFLLVSGYGVEGARMVVEQVPPAAGWYSFVGYPLGRALAALPLDWTLAYRVVWWLHAVAGMAFVAYVPYSRLLHLLTGPLTLAASAARRRPSAAAVSGQARAS
ncbi:MAG: hypothetical protein HY690_11630 [Chloroflexi bacterium]|nr:hypothetical protein [Chloroflexota bacterium]